MSERKRQSNVNLHVVGDKYLLEVEVEVSVFELTNYKEGSQTRGEVKYKVAALGEDTRYFNIGDEVLVDGSAHMIPVKIKDNPKDIITLRELYNSLEPKEIQEHHRNKTKVITINHLIVQEYAMLGVIK